MRIRMMTKAPLSRHAQQRRKQMGITEDRIDATIAEPDAMYPGSTSHPSGRTCYQRGDLVVVVQDSTGEVVTILWHRREGR